MRSRSLPSTFAVALIAVVLLASGPLVRTAAAEPGLDGTLPAVPLVAPSPNLPVATLPSVTFSLNDNYGFDVLDYGVVPPGTPMQVDITGEGVDGAVYSVDGGPETALYCWSADAGLSCSLYDTYWSDGSHLVRVEALSSGAIVGSHTFTVYVDSGATWPMDTVDVNVVLIGFPESPADVQNTLWPAGWAYLALTEDPANDRLLAMPYHYNIVQAPADYADGLIAQAAASAVYRDDLQARLNLPALINQRESGIPQDIFDPLLGYELQSSWLEGYIQAHPLLPSGSTGVTFYFVNLESLDDPANGVDHWFARPFADTDTGRDENWWRLEWANDLNIPMGYPMNIFGGPDRTVFIDPTAYQWYLDWAYVWWQGGNGRAPYGYEYEELAPEARAGGLASIVNDLLGGLVSALPWMPVQEDNILIRNYVLDGSTTKTAEDLSWVVHDAPLLGYLQSFLPFKNWQIETTVESIEALPTLKTVVDGLTTYVGDHGYIDGDATWDYLYAHKADFVPDDPNTFEILTVDFIYDDRSMVSPSNGGKEFTGLGGSGITVIFMQTNRFYDSEGLPLRGLTNTIAHESGHNLGFGHQFGPHYLADFVDGGMGYFREELTYGSFWEEALYRVYDHAELLFLLDLLNTRDPLPLSAEFRTFYSDFAASKFLAAYEDLQHIDNLLTDPVPPVADAGLDATALVNVPVAFDGTGSTDNLRIASYVWDFGDGISGQGPVVNHAFTAPGTYSVTLTVTDLGGNTASDTVLVVVSAPVLPPVAMISGVWDAYGVVVPYRGSTVSTTLVFAFTADHPSAVASYHCGIDGTWATCASPVTLVGLLPGIHIFQLFARDASGADGLPPALFIWTVLTPAQGTAALMDMLRGMSLPSGTTQSLLDPLHVAYKALADGKPSGDLKACKQLDLFLEVVRLYEARGRLTPAQGESLSIAAIEIEAAIRGS